MAIADLPDTKLERCICLLTEPLPLARCGGKAWHLRRMLELHLPVPAGLVVRAEAFDSFLERNGLQGPIDAQLGQVKPDDPASQTAASRCIQDLIAQASIPAQILDLLAQSLPQLASLMVAVRSSAIGEDSAQHSYAGQLDSVLNVDREVEAVGAALKKCWASYWSPRAIAYQRSRGIALAGMAVIIQEQVPAAISGVLFTRHPAAAADDSQRDWMLAEYCAGLGDALVGGRISPGRLLISRSSRQIRSEGPADPSPDDGVPIELDEVAALTLANYGRALEEAFGGPQDIEWSIAKGGQLWLLQSRPITAAAAHSARRPAKSEPLVVWTNANVNENFPEPISPLLYSIASLGYYHYFRNLGVALGISPRRIAAMEEPLRNLVGVHGARLYYNLTNIHAVLRMAPFGELLADSFNQFVGADDTPPAGGSLTWNGFSSSRIGQSLEVSRIAACSLWRLKSVAAGVARFERAADAFAAATVPVLLERATLADLRGHLRDFLKIRCHQWLGASLADASAMLSYGLLKRLLAAEFPGDQQAALHNSLLRGLCDVVSSRPAELLWKLSRDIRANPELRDLFACQTDAEILRQLESRDHFAAFWTALGRYLDEWGFRCSGELMLTVPSFQERPEGVIALLRSYAGVEGESPGERLARQQTERQRETRRVHKLLPRPLKALAFTRLLNWTQRAIMLRERARLKQALLYSRCRRIALAIGARLVAAGTFQQPDDVFFLTADELDALVSGHSMFPGHTAQLVALRRTAHAEVSQTRPPDTFAIPAGSYWRSDQAGTAASGLSSADPGNQLRGSGVCGGVATAPAAVLESVTQLERLSAGDILVTRETDPGWAPVFPLIQGLVMERGGMLSHGAILAREYGLPTVVGIPDVTRRITPGQTVTVNGDRGFVELS
jgi:pyruvate,water dikinase